MTYKEKLYRECPTLVDGRWQGGCKGCPDTYEYEAESDCLVLDDMTYEEKNLQCTECWNREMSKEEKS